jgi:hypothetical protein
MSQATTPARLSLRERNLQVRRELPPGVEVILSVAEAAAVLGVSVRSIERYEKAGLEIVRYSKRRRGVRQSALKRFIKQRLAGSQEAA